MQGEFSVCQFFVGDSYEVRAPVYFCRGNKMIITMQNLENLYRAQRYFSALSMLGACSELDEVALGQATALAVDYKSLRKYVANPENEVISGY